MITRLFNAIRAKVTYTLNGKTRVVSGVHTFDVDSIAEVRSPSISLGADGSVTVDAAGDEDTAKIHVTVGENADPDDPTASNADATIVGRGGSVDTGVDVAMGSTAHVKARGENHAGELAPSSTIKGAKSGRGVGESTKVVRIPATQLSSRIPKQPVQFTADGEMQPSGGSLDVFHEGVGAVVLPVGVRVVGFAFHGFRANSGSLVKAQLVHVPDSGSGAVVSQLELTTTGSYSSDADTSVDETVGAGDQFAIYGLMRPDTARDDCRIRWFEITYEADNLSQSL